MVSNYIEDVFRSYDCRVGHLLFTVIRSATVTSFLAAFFLLWNGDVKHCSICMWSKVLSANILGMFSLFHSQPQDTNKKNLTIYCKKEGNIECFIEAFDPCRWEFSQDKTLDI